jgi:6-phosphogluconolactonase
VGVFALQSNGSIGQLAQLQLQSGSGPYPRRQEHSEPHYIVFDPGRQSALISDLGADRVFAYHFDPAAHRLTLAGETALTPGSGPRHTVLDARGRYFYVITELTAALHVYSWDAKRAALTPIQTLSVYPADYSADTPRSGAEIRMSKDGHFVYASLRGDQNSIVVFAVNPRDGTVKYVDRMPTGGKRPMSFTIDPTGRWLLAANVDSDTVTVLKIDPGTGRMTAQGSLPVPKPVSIAFYGR